jgi:hypothetical protein
LNSTKGTADSCQVFLRSYSLPVTRMIVITGTNRGDTQQVPNSWAVLLNRDPFGHSTRLRNANTEYQSYMCTGLSYVAMHASFTASDNVGWPWQVRAMSSEDAPYSIARTHSAMSSPALAPTMCAPRILSVFLSATILTIPSVSSMALHHQGKGVSRARKYLLTAQDHPDELVWSLASRDNDCLCMQLFI